MYWCSSAASSLADFPSCPKGFSTTTRAVLVSSASDSPFTTVPNRKGGISEIEHGRPFALDRVGHSSVGSGVAEIALHVGEPLREAIEHFLVQHLTGTLDAIPRMLLQLVDRPVVDGHPDDRAVQQVAHLQPVERPERHHLRQIAGDPEHDEHVRRLRLG